MTESRRRASNPGRYVGAFVITAFGAGWLATWWLSGTARSVGVIVAIAALAAVLAGIALVRFGRARRLDASVTPGRNPTRIRLAFTAIVIAEGVAIYWVTAALARAGLDEWIVPGVILIVGLHFLPLARIFRYRPYTLTGLALVVVAGGLPWILPDGPSSAQLPLWAGIILWSTAVGVLAR